ncbi:helix-turn-helix domain-containing protein [Pseudactinotalea terrae]|uniref:helix-turn-helix domain-containing protein n=1 Tax=Pseudactinotalea terrae TaxID=1743262 RepID=UPI0012E1B8B7|nr:helix-turn-helix domain-containing protein [Pseudactinotalea terrae]
MNTVLALRREAGLTQDELAARSGVAQPNIAAYEAGRRKPSAAMLARLRQAASPLPRDAVAAKREALVALAEKFHFENVRIFGSVRHRADTPRSDVDLLLHVPSGTGLMTIAAFALEAEELLGVKVDIVTEGGLRTDHPILRDAVAL